MYYRKNGAVVAVIDRSYTRARQKLATHHDSGKIQISGRCQSWQWWNTSGSRQNDPPWCSCRKSPQEIRREIRMGCHRCCLRTCTKLSGGVNGKGWGKIIDVVSNLPAPKASLLRRCDMAHNITCRSYVHWGRIQISDPFQSRL